MTAEPPTSQYDLWHRQRAIEETSPAEGGSRLTSAWHRMVLPRLGHLAGQRVAEIGCGRGDLAIHMAQRGARVTALDFSATAIAVARERAEGATVSVTWLQADAQETGLPNEAFDLVISCECMEHVPTPARMARELFRITAPGGRCLITTPSYLNGTILAWLHAKITRRPYNSGAGVQPIEHFFTYPYVKALLRGAGFKIMETDARLFPLLLLPRVDPAKLRIESFRSPFLRRLATPFGLHILYVLEKLAT